VGLTGSPGRQLISRERECGKTLASGILFGQAEPVVCLRWLSAASYSERLARQQKPSATDFTPSWVIASPETNEHDD